MENLLRSKKAQWEKTQSLKHAQAEELSALIESQLRTQAEGQGSLL